MEIYEIEKIEKISIKFSSKIDDEQKQTRFTITKPDKSQLEDSIQGLTITVADDTSLVYPSISSMNKETDFLNNLLGHSGTLSLYVSFGLIEKVVTLKLNQISVKVLPAKKKEKITVTQSFKTVLENFPMKHPWVVHFDLNNVNVDDFYVVYCFKILTSKDKQKYIGSCVVSLRNFISNENLQNTAASFNILALPIDFEQIKKSSLIIDECLDLPKPMLFVILYYNSTTGMLEVGCTALYTPSCDGLSPKEIVVLLKFHDTNDVLILESYSRKTLKIYAEKTEDIEVIDRESSFPVLLKDILGCTLVIHVSINKKSPSKLKNITNEAFERKKIGYISMGRWNSSIEAKNHFNKIASQPDTVHKQWQRLLI
ncbi:hypothetical protein RF11_02208 [Thelohanellus kitauei]|uniref:Uncharacterized protein n=1 Tax=Thelohanellus kitauei TaxID=669202 RepID=A0A0C2MGA5_THEKT|nr:hypothetical protein RF11_02208 [Thelohanellus kitauei]